MTPPTIPFHPRTPSAPLIGELSAQLTEGLSYLENRNCRGESDRPPIHLRTPTGAGK